MAEPDRRGRAARGSEGLLERGRTLERIQAVLAEARAGEGGALLVEGHPGLGKTRLHEATLDLARSQGMRTLRAVGAELERNVAHGVARQLLTRLLDALGPEERAAVLSRALEPVRLLAGLRQSAAEPAAAEEDAPAGDLAISHAVFTAIAIACESAPIVVAVDDLHWCDAASLELVLYLLQRIRELPLAMVLARRAGMSSATGEVMERIATHPAVAVEVLPPLTPAAVRELVCQALGEDTGESVIDACFQATAGNPFYLHELLLALADDPRATPAELAQRAQSLAPDAVTRSLRVRVGRLGAGAGELARTTAILGDEVPLRQAAALAQMSLREAAAAADELSGAEVLLAREPLQYVHPLVRRAIELDIPAAQRATRHLDAARLLYAEGESAERVAAQLLLGRAEGSDWVVRRLQAAAREARARGSARSAVDYLRRALEEPPSDSLRGEVLAELGAAEAAVGAKEAVKHLAQAAELCPDPVRRAELLRAQGRVLYELGRYRLAAEAYTRARETLEALPGPCPDTELSDRIETGYVATASQVPELRAQALARSEQLLERAEHRPATEGQRWVLAQAALREAFAARPAGQVSALVERAWDHGRMLEGDGADGVAWSLATQALTLSGELERALELVEHVLADATRRGSPLAFATASYARGLPLLWRGQVSEAIADLEHALEATRYGWQRFMRAARATLALCLLERGEPQLAEAELQAAGSGGSANSGGQADLEDVYVLTVRAQLRLAQNQPRAALEDALTAGRAIGPEIRNLGYSQWRTIAAQAALSLGEREQALELAREALELADEVGAVHARMRSRWVMGLVLSDSEGREMLREAVSLGEAGPQRLETVRALIELGSALRRDNQRTAAREHLQRAADLALAGGALALHERAHTELSAAGARPRRQWLLHGPESLTASERRIAELAAAGRSNREIAQALFVTPKTVEYHLRNAYRKLDIEGRGELGGALGLSSPPGGR